MNIMCFLKKSTFSHIVCEEVDLDFLNIKILSKKSPEPEMISFFFIQQLQYQSYGSSLLIVDAL